jgi:hypothetical protein
MDPLSLLACALVVGFVAKRRHAPGRGHAPGWRQASCERRHV